MIDIRYNPSDHTPASMLSNLYPRQFIFKGFTCNSIEGVLQGMKYPMNQQQKIFKLYGFKAKRAGKGMDITKTLTIGKFIVPPLHTPEYLMFLEDLFYTAYDNNAASRRLLLNTNDELKHTVGHNNKHKTVLTKSEFINTLYKVKLRLKTASLF